ncbi:response regulator transcription factor [Streptomyces sp. NPDC048717]|uniref:response regulator transcription factor n=1 Tax=Streptomyces sp. NPDC048717 TaxID=3154928 RepID=UPI00342ED472
MVRTALRVILDAEPDLEVVGEAANGAEAVSVVRELRPDVVLMDVRMPGIDGIQATRRILAGRPDGVEETAGAEGAYGRDGAAGVGAGDGDTAAGEYGSGGPGSEEYGGGRNGPRVVVVTTFENDSYVYEALRVGASGFLLKRAAPEELVSAVRLVARSESLLYPAAVRGLAAEHARRRPAPAPPWAARLTDREAEVLRRMAKGLTNAEIAGLMGVGPATVKTHVAAVLAKTGTRDRTQAVIAAYESGFITPG